MSVLATHPELVWPPAEAGDPFIGLEAADSAAVDAWVQAQHTRTIRRFGETALCAATGKRLLEADLTEDRIATCSRFGDWGYNLWVEHAGSLGMVRRTRWDAWLAGAPQWQTILELDAIDPDSSEPDDVRWHLLEFSLLYPDGERALVSLSPEGADACIVREFDVATRRFVEGGFELLEPGNHSITWIDRDTVHVGWDDSATGCATPALTACMSPRIVRRWQRGTAIETAPIVFEGDADDLAVTAWLDLSAQRQLALRVRSGAEESLFWLDEHNGEWQPYDVPDHICVATWQRWLLLTLHSDWQPHDQTYVRGSLLAIEHDAFVAGSRRFMVLFTPCERQALCSIDCTRNWIVVTHKRDGAMSITLWRPPAHDAAPWDDRELALPAASEVSVSAVAPLRDDTVLIHVDHFLVPPTLYHADLASDAPWQRVARMPAQFDAAGLRAERRDARAADGTPIPYWLIARAEDLRAHTARPCLLHGYGGFEVSLDTPAYLDAASHAWLECGGAIAIACIRGGGEQGLDWHQAGQREGRQVAFDDFIAVSEALIGSGVTTSNQLAITGNSNGGLLTAACMMQRPELFGAVISEVPLLDMARFHVLHRGAAWIDEYGNPDDADDLRYLLAYSPYHNVRADVAYPPVLFVTSTSDDRVHPGHARKMVARMQALGHARVWLLEYRSGGHGAGIEPQSAAERKALCIEFLRSMLGMQPADDIG